MNIIINKKIKTDDKDFIYYICGDEECKHYSIDFDDLCYRLATYIFDNDYSLESLNKIRKTFGDDVFNQVYKNLMERNHDT